MKFKIVIILNNRRPMNKFFLDKLLYERLLLALSKKYDSIKITYANFFMHFQSCFDGWIFVLSSSLFTCMKMEMESSKFLKLRKLILTEKSLVIEKSDNISSILISQIIISVMEDKFK